MSFSPIRAGVFVALLTVSGGSVASASEADPNPMNRYPAYSEPFRGGLQSSGVRLERRDVVPQRRVVVPQDTPWSRGGAGDGSPYDRNVAPTGGGY